MATHHYAPRHLDSWPEHVSGVSAKGKIDHAGRMLIPAKFRKSLKLTTGSEVILVVNDGILEVHSIENAIREAQAIVRRHVPAGRSLVDELINERRQESAREQ